MLTNNRENMNLRNGALLIGAAAIALGGLAGCSSDSTSSDTSASASDATSAASPSASDTASASASETGSASASASGSAAEPECDAQSLLAVLPKGSTMDKFTCADQDGQDYAAVQVKEGPTVFFLTWNGKTWDVATSDEVCGTASAGYPPDILAYCTSASD